jgi:hypothetical protein
MTKEKELDLSEITKEELFELVQNSMGILDTPIMRRRFDGDIHYQETIKQYKEIKGKVKECAMNA